MPTYLVITRNPSIENIPMSGSMFFTNVSQLEWERWNVIKPMIMGKWERE